MRHTVRLMILGMLPLMAACGTQKSALQGNTATSSGTRTEASASKTVTESFALVQKVNDAKVTESNIVSDLTFSATMGSKDVSVPGSLHMRKDQIIRLQLFVPILHTEVGRLEFTPDYVLVVDRIHKQYVKEDYNKLDFLRDNGLNFYSLQALFWNQLFIPGENSVTEAGLQKFKASSGAQEINISLNSGNMAYRWNASNATGLISDALVTYTSSAHGSSSLTWKYSNFKPVKAKMFPAYEEFTFKTTASKKVQNVKVVLDMDGIETSSKWDTETTLSSKYKKIEATDIFSKLFSM